MNTTIYNFGDVKVFIDSHENRFVTIGEETERFGLYAMDEVNKIFSKNNNAEEAYKEVFKRLTSK